MKRNLLFLCAGLWSLSLSAMEGGCFKSVFEDVDRAGLLEYYEEKRAEDREEDSEHDTGESGAAESGISLEPSNNRENLKAKLDRKLTRLFNAERRAVLAEHLPEQVISVLRRARAHHQELYGELETPRYARFAMHSGRTGEEALGSSPAVAEGFVGLASVRTDSSARQISDTKREELERKLMRIILFELCVKLGQEGQDLADMSRGQDGWVGCCKGYWTIMGALTLTAVGFACYAPFAPCVPWHG
jgi:hypothetical protein